MQTHLRDVELVWIAGELVYGTAMVVQSVRSTGCEEVMVQGASKRLCTPFMTLVGALGKEFAFLVPVVR